jgi:hypothetical protein
MKPVPGHVLSHIVDYDYNVGGLVNQLSTQTSGLFSRKRALSLEYIYILNGILHYITKTHYHKYRLDEDDIIIDMCVHFEERGVDLKSHVGEINDTITYFKDSSFGTFNETDLDSDIVRLVFETAFYILIRGLQTHNVYGYLAIELFEQINANDVRDIGDLPNAMGSIVGKGIMIKLVSCIQTKHEFASMFKYVNHTHLEFTSCVLLLSEVVAKIRELGLNGDSVFTDLISLFAKYVYNIDYAETDGAETFREINELCDEYD